MDDFDFIEERITTNFLRGRNSSSFFFFFFGPLSRNEDTAGLARRAKARQERRAGRRR